ncbi:hypothetical protein BJ508DRAFT_89625 [Ascobolus immersus RN42]|uniref:Uncharacterized protein n=1 Tax=Ascobolus immersus RN42 TaxID=1160509 RepID=A0A3N4HAP3_ASCIM|nr:hypothetical protein BJ508DRAFT_89625 [Ascobolus immersus RN42]
MSVRSIVERCGGADIGRMNYTRMYFLLRTFCLWSVECLDIGEMVESRVMFGLASVLMSGEEMRTRVYSESALGGNSCDFRAGVCFDEWRGDEDSCKVRSGVGVVRILSGREMNSTSLYLLVSNSSKPGTSLNKNILFGYDQLGLRCPASVLTRGD